MDLLSYGGALVLGFPVLMLLMTLNLRLACSALRLAKLTRQGAWRLSRESTALLWVLFVFIGSLGSLGMICPVALAALAVLYCGRMDLEILPATAVAACQVVFLAIEFGISAGIFALSGLSL